MKKRTKQNVKYWEQLRKRMYKAYPASRLTENRWQAVQALLNKKYPEIASHPKIIDFLKDADYNNRQIRLDTEGEEEEKKVILSQQYQLNNII